MPSVQSHREAGPGIRLTRVMQGSIEWSLLISPIRHAPRYRWAVVFAERTAWAFGLICLRTWGAMYIEGVTGAHRELERFAVLQAAAAQQTAAPDMSLWSRERISAWQRALNEPAPPPLAVLRIPKLRLEVPVLPGTDDFTLNRGVGHIEDTALPGTDGNSGIAGHRDGFLRGLKDVAPDDAIELETLQGKEVYRVERTWVVDPEDVSVLNATPTRSLTLVTCYPFYHVGPAPQRFTSAPCAPTRQWPFPGAGEQRSGVSARRRSVAVSVLAPEITRSGEGRSRRNSGAARDDDGRNPGRATREQRARPSAHSTGTCDANGKIRKSPRS